MPTYEYECRSCGKHHEIFQSMKDEPLKKCPECGKNTLKRLLGTGAGIIFKGGGFYCTDYRSDSYKKGKDSEKSSSSSSSSSSETKTGASSSDGPAKKEKAAAAEKA